MAGALFGDVEVSLFLAGALYLVKFNCHFAWQAHYLVNCGIVAGARNVIFFNRKCLRLSAKSNLGSEAGCGLTGSFRMMLGS